VVASKRRLKGAINDIYRWKEGDATHSDYRSDRGAAYASIRGDFGATAKEFTACKPTTPSEAIGEAGLLGRILLREFVRVAILAGALTFAIIGSLLKSAIQFLHDLYEFFRITFCACGFRQFPPPVSSGVSHGSSPCGLDCREAVQDVCASMVFAYSLPKREIKLLQPSTAVIRERFSRFW
jgi:hypothetical protein